MTYAVIYADPPWKFRVCSDRGKDRSASERWYDCMSIDAIRAFPAWDYAAPGAPAQA